MATTLKEAQKAWNELTALGVDETNTDGVHLPLWSRFKLYIDMQRPMIERIFGQKPLDTVGTLEQLAAPEVMMKLRQATEAYTNLTSMSVPIKGFDNKEFTLWQRIQLYAERDLPSVDDKDLQVTFEQTNVSVETVPEKKEEPTFTLSSDQDRAWKKIQAWLSDQVNSPYFVLRGYAGTGKTHLMKMLATSVVDRNVYFTAPTNKATKVLSKMLGIRSKTIYSLLGLRMSNDEEESVLKWPDKLPELSRGCVIVVDEAGMVNSELCKFIEEARKLFNAQIMYVGDPAQLPPVKEEDSPCWYVTEEPKNRSMLKKVMRFDNQLLKLATYLRECVKNGERPVFYDDNANGEGVFKVSERKFWKELLPENSSPKDFLDKKVLAWRNKTVNSYNEIIRQHLGFGGVPYAIGELLMIAQPVEIFGSVAATIDEEVLVEKVTETTVYLKGYNIPVHELLVRTEDDVVLKLNVPTDDDIVLQTLLSELAAKAKRSKKEHRRIAWKEFWEAKSKFHSVRYGYCLTVHRAQGSTYRCVFADTVDILANREEDTANRCAYVSATRPSLSFYTF